MSKLAPIVLFVYNRLKHTQQTIEALKANTLAKDSLLFIYSDCSKDNADEIAQHEVKKVRDYIHELQEQNKQSSYFNNIEIIEREKNYGLAKSIINGVSEIVEKYGKVIVLEDDLVTNPYFLTFMNEALDIYQDREEVGCISGFIFPLENEDNIPNTFFLKGADCWGWATWQRAWKHFNPNGKDLLQQLKKSKKIKDFDISYYNKKCSRGYVTMLEGQIAGQNQSWAIRWIASCFLQDMYCLYPKYSFVKNIGFDTGTHCNNGKENDPYFGILSNQAIEIDTTQQVTEHIAARIASDKYYTQQAIPLLKSLRRKIKNFIKDAIATERERERE